jgi:hypothetical protein
MVEALRGGAALIVVPAAHDPAKQPIDDPAGQLAARTSIAVPRPGKMSVPISAPTLPN